MFLLFAAMSCGAQTDTSRMLHIDSLFIGHQIKAYNIRNGVVEGISNKAGMTLKIWVAYPDTSRTITDTTFKKPE